LLSIRIPSHKGTKTENELGVHIKAGTFAASKVKPSQVMFALQTATNNAVQLTNA